MHTSAFYSGGRLHMYQFGWTLASLGAEVYLITNRNPMWRNDYPQLKNFRIVNLKDPHSIKPPEDLDLIVTDGKSAPGTWAKNEKARKPHIPLICLNFETPNWVKKLAPKVGGMPKLEGIFSMADLLLCNSKESLKWLGEYMDLGDKRTGVLHPAANTFALSGKCDNPFDTDRPYIVWSSRASRYKGAHVVAKAVEDYPGVLDCVMIGKPNTVPRSTQDHRFITFDTPINDAQKFRLMKDAQCVAAPSLFEGYGMVPAEALCAGSPVVVYDLPVLRQEYGDRLVYAKHGNVDDFKLHLYAVLANRPEVDQEDAVQTYVMPAMRKTVSDLPFVNLNKRRIGASMICYYGPTVQEAIASVYPHVDEIRIAYGPTELWADIPPDNALELIRSFPDPDKKIEVITKPVWKNKGEMRAATTTGMDASHLLIVDADEIYYNLDLWLERDIEFGCPRWVHFWHDLEHYVVDAPGQKRWGFPHELGGSQHWHFRYARWRASNKWKPKGTYAVGVGGCKVHTKEQTDNAVKKCPEACIFHLSHVLQPAIMRAKHEFYRERDGDNAGRKQREAAWHNWNGQLGDCGDGVIRAVEFDVPELVKQAYEKARMS
jgi:glycosyltransferase involved in cell wall biosynthesis